MSSNTPLPSSFDGNADFYEENRWQKFARRLKEEPLIPFGCALTCFALLGATRSIRAGDHNKTNRMFRARIYAQGFTLVAMVAGSMYWQTDRQKRKEFEGVIAEQKAKEKNELWIKELEARDEEAKEIRAAREARRKALQEQRDRGDTQSVTEAVLEKQQQQATRGTGPSTAATSVVDENEAKGKSITDYVSGLWGK